MKQLSCRLIGVRFARLSLWAFALLITSTTLNEITLQAAFATNIKVDTATDGDGTLGSLTGDGDCSLREAIQNANSDSNASYPDCLAGSGADTISFDGVSSLTLKEEISVITDVKIQGAVELAGDGDTRL